MSASGAPVRSFNMQLSPNYAGPLDTRMVGFSSLDRPTQLLYDGLFRFEIATGKFVYATKVDGVWTWKELSSLDNLPNNLTLQGTLTVPKIVLNTEDLSTKLSGYYLKSGGPISGSVTIQSGGLTVAGDTTLTGNVNIGGNLTVPNITLNSENLSTKLAGYYLKSGGVISGNVTIQSGGLTVTGTTKVTGSVNTTGTLTVPSITLNSENLNNKLSGYYLKSGGLISGNVTIQSGGLSVVGNTSITGNLSVSNRLTVQSISLNSDDLGNNLDNLKNRLLALETRTTAVAYVPNTPDTSDYTNGTALLPFAWVHNPSAYVFKDSNTKIEISSPGTYRFIFTASSLASGAGYNDAFVCILTVHDVNLPNSNRYVASGWGYNEWNGGGYTRHQAPVLIDETIVRVSGFQVSVSLNALDGQMMRGTIVIQRLA